MPRPHVHPWKEGTPPSHRNVNRGGQVHQIKAEALSPEEVETNVRPAKTASIFATLLTLLKAVPCVSIHAAPNHPSALSSNGTSLRKPSRATPSWPEIPLKDMLPAELVILGLFGYQAEAHLLCWTKTALRFVLSTTVSPEHRIVPGK